MLRVYEPTSQPTNQPTNHPASQPTNQPTNHNNNDTTLVESPIFPSAPGIRGYTMEDLDMQLMARR